MTLRSWHIDNLIGLVVVLAALGTVAAWGHPVFAQPWLWPLAGLALTAAAIESAWLLPRRHASYRYRVDCRSVVVESGVLVVRQLIVPLHQVLYVETLQGPVLRAYGLTRIRLGTIADPKTIGPLTRDAAARLRSAIEAARLQLSDHERRS